MGTLDYLIMEIESQGLTSDARVIDNKIEVVIMSGLFHMSYFIDKPDRALSIVAGELVADFRRELKAQNQLELL